jgi:hypothetical protein
MITSKRQIVSVDVYEDSVKKLMQGVQILRECLNNGNRLPKNVVNDVVEAIIFLSIKNTGGILQRPVL